MHSSLIPVGSDWYDIRQALLRSVTEIPEELGGSELAVCRSHYSRVHGIVNTSTGQIIPLNCKSWRCPVHRKSWLHRWRIVVTREAKINPFDKLITLTCASKCTPLQLNYARKLLCADLRVLNGEFEYVSVLEFTTQSRLPHLHLLARSVYTSQAVLSSLWARATTLSGMSHSPIVYIEAPRSVEGGAVYALSYALDGDAKHQDIPASWRGRKISYSHKFFQAAKPGQHWQDYITENFPARTRDEWKLIPTSVSAIVEATFKEHLLTFEH